MKPDTADMQRIPEPELMDDQTQAEAYAAADFDEAHRRIVDVFDDCFPGGGIEGCILDLGCGPGDISFRFAARHPACTVTGVDGSAAMIRRRFTRPIRRRSSTRDSRP